MAAIDAGSRPRDSLPSISHLDLEKARSDRNDLSRYSMVNGLSISTGPLTSPTASMYSSPHPPYSCGPSTAGSMSGLTGYISPPESTTRRSTRDDKDSPPGLRKSLPSIHEALGDNSMSFSGSLPTSTQHQSLPTPSTAVAPSFAEGPKGPTNPFSQLAPGPPVLRDVFSGAQKNVPASTETQSCAAPPPPVTASDPRQQNPPHFGYPSSPRSHPASTFRSSTLMNTSFANHNEPPPARSPQAFDPARQPYSFPQYGAPSSTNQPPSNEPYQFTGGSKPDEQQAQTQAQTQAQAQRSGSDGQYSETVKRHLEVFDTELGLNEISEASARTLDFARIWAQRYHQGSRSGYYQDSLPGMHEIDDILRQSHRIFENLTHLREVVIAQQTALSEQRARLVRGSHSEDDYHGLSDEYKSAIFSGTDGKKRRGKAAPPGRCHSCNRAETPEWRRGPDGARTLCNACGLHYAKLTRKMGVNKAAAMTGSNLRPKHLEGTRP